MTRDDDEDGGQAREGARGRAVRALRRIAQMYGRVLRASSRVREWLLARRNGVMLIAALVTIVAAVITAAGAYFSYRQVKSAELSARQAAEFQQSAALDAKRARQYQAWQTINLATGKPGDLGRRQALEELNEDRVNFRFVDLSHADLEGIDLRRAFFHFAVLSGANLFRADLRHAEMSRADLRGADLFQARLDSVGFRDADLSGANLSEADLTGADLAGYTDPESLRTNLANANLRAAVLKGANLEGVRNLTRSQLLRAREWRGARLPYDLRAMALSNSATIAQRESLRVRVWEELVRTGEWKQEPETLFGSPVAKSIDLYTEDGVARSVSMMP